jgi:GH15 family glucan-1,4-alpha-glucosidase
MDAFVSSGYHDEARALAGWVLSTVAATPAKDLRVLYTLEGGQAPRESYPDLPGYEGSRPVRFGNDAVDQFQLDAYGHVMECLHLWLGLRRLDRPGLWPHVVELVDRCCERWRGPDHGIWELPFGKRQLTYSKVMAWVALDRAIKAAEAHGLPAPLARWDATRGEIRRDVMENGVDPTTGAFTQAYGDPAADASNLRLAIVGFVQADDARYQATLREVERQLARGGFLLRYAKEDGLEGKEGAFLACSFWLVEALALAGRREEARQAFERLAALASPLGLFAEEYDPAAKRHLGNFPQAFTHAALVSAAWQLVGPASTRERGAHEPEARMGQEVR